MKFRETHLHAVETTPPAMVQGRDGRVIVFEFYELPHRIAMRRLDEIAKHEKWAQQIEGASTA